MIFQERTYAVLLVSAAQSFNHSIMNLLPMTDYWPVNTVDSVAAARRALLERSYDIVIINAPLPDDFGSRLAIDVCTESGAAAMILVKSDVYNDVYRKVMEFGVFTLSKPTSPQMLRQALQWMASARERLRATERSAATVEQKMEEIRLVNRAKWLLIECLGMSEAEAHRYIEKQAMDRCVSRREIARGIIQTYG